MNRSIKLAALAAIAALSLLLASCSESSASDTTVDDCVADGTCAEGPDLGSGDADSTPGEPEGTYLGMPVGFTADGFPYIGDPDAPVSIVEFTDYLCPFCQRHTTQTTPALLLEYGIPGEVNFVLRDYPLAVLHPTAPEGHAAALCVAEQGAELFWQYHGELFRQQGAWSGLSEPSAFLASTAEELGVDMAAYSSCVEDGGTDRIVAERVTEGEGFGFTGTPSFKLVENSTGTAYDVIGAQSLALFQQYVDALLVGDAPPGAVPSTGLVSQDEDTAPVTVPTFTVDPDSQDMFQGLSVGFTADGYPFIGSPDAPVTVLEYTDYLCPFCQRHTTQTHPSLLEEYAATGEVNFVFRDFPLAGLHPTAPTGHTASLCVAEQGAAFFWAYHDLLFFNQSQWSGLSDPSGFLAQTAQEIGVDIDAYEDCLASGRTAPVVDARVAEGRSLGFNGTPSFQFVNNATADVFELVGAQPLERFQSFLDALIAGEEPPDAEDAQEQSSELPFWANVAGLVADPDRPGYTLAGDAFKGDPNAPMVVVEFSDFECPSCQRHTLEAQPVVDEAFIETGQIMWVYKHLPLRSHEYAPAAAAAAECAGDQGEFWAMHDLLFETLEEWAAADADPVLSQLAGRLGLNQSAFDACLNSREALERVLDDLYDADGLIEQTPSFVIIYGGQGRRLEGARSADDLVAILTTQLESAVEVSDNR